ncbi:arsenite methyltransferase [Halosimplex salinum]|uniref:arsenite methyltransferase n=1 Tax=Halosimplex salinum TaxID=1710538 RepID=UPI000F47EA6C|nr:arsenite methyltransferase [Halosimplex salinum]
MTDDATTDGEADGLDPSDQRAAVRDRYGSITTESPSDSCCDTSCSDETTAEADRLGYSDEDVATVDPDAYLGLGCGNPTAIAELNRGEDVLDLGSGGGFDCFLAAQAVGDDGRVVGVDMTPEMVERARETAETTDASNVEFRLGEIEHLPVPDESVDVILSNCVVNLSPDKPQVFREAYRVLRPGGRLAVSDVVLTADLPVDLAADPDSVAACVGGASTVEEIEAMATDAGFVDVAIEPDDDSEAFIREWDDERDLSDYVVAATIEGTRPDAAH